VRNYLDQVGLWACLWGIILLTLIEVGRPVHYRWHYALGRGFCSSEVNGGWTAAPPQPSADTLMHWRNCLNVQTRGPCTFHFQRLCSEPSRPLPPSAKLLGSSPSSLTRQQSFCEFIWSQSKVWFSVSQPQKGDFCQQWRPIRLLWLESLSYWIYYFVSRNMCHENQNPL